MKNLLILALALPLVACSKAVEAEQSTTTPAAAILTDQAIAKSTHTVMCGCDKTIGKSCGNYIQIDNQFVQIANSKDLGLGPMEWCHADPTKAEVVGTVADGKFVATSLTVVSK